MQAKGQLRTATERSRWVGFIIHIISTTTERQSWTKDAVHLHITSHHITIFTLQFVFAPFISPSLCKPTSSPMQSFSASFNQSVIESVIQSVNQSPSLRQIHLNGIWLITARKLKFKIPLSHFVLLGLYTNNPQK